MKRYFSLIASMMLLLNMVIPSLSVFAVESTTDNIKQWEASKNVPTDKVWTISFNGQVNKGAALSELVYVVDQDGNRAATTVSYEKELKKLYVNPPEAGYETNTTYTLVIDEGLHSINKTKMKQTIHKEFTTAATASKETDFEVRSDSKNELTLQENVYEVDEKDVVTPTDGETVTLTNAHNYNAGDIITLPPTEDFPFGYFGKVSNIEVIGETYKLTLEETSLDDLIENFDVSQSALAEPIFSDEVMGASSKSVSALGSFNDAVKFVETKDGWNLVINDLGFEKSGETPKENTDSKKKKGKSTISVSGKGSLLLSGKISLDKPKLTYDIDENRKLLARYYSPKNLGVKMKQSTDLTAELKGNLYGRAEFPIAEMPLGLGIKLPRNLKAGVLLKITLVVELDVDGNVTYTLKKSYTPSAGIKKIAGTKNDYEGYAKITPSGKGLTLEDAKIEATLDNGIYADVDLAVGSQSLAKISVDPVFTAAINAGTLYSSDVKNACYESSLDFNTHVEVGVVEYSFWDGFSEDLKSVYDYDIPTINLAKSSTCHLENLKFENASVSLKAGESKTVKVLGTTNSKQAEIKLPNDAVTFKSKSSYVKVNTSGKITANKNTPDKHNAVINVTYTKNGQKLTDSMVVTVSNPPEKPKPDETEKPDTSEEPKPGETEKPDTGEEPKPGETEKPDTGEEPKPGEIESPDFTNTYYKNNYLVENTKDEKVEINTGLVADYIVYDEYGVTFTKKIGSDSFTLPKKGSAIVSYPKEHKEMTVATGVKVSKSTKPAFSVIEIMKNQSAIFKDKIGKEQYIYLNNDMQSADYAYAAYNADGTVRDAAYDDYNWYDGEKQYLSSGGETVFSNTGNYPVRLYSLYNTTDAKLTNENAMLTYNLDLNQSVKITFKNLKDNRAGGIYNSANYEEYDLASYNPNKTLSYIDKMDNENNYYNSLPSVSGGETIATNTGSLPLIVYGATRSIKYEATNEKALANYVLNPGEKVSVSTTEPVSSSTTKVITDASSVSYNYISYNADGNTNALDRNNVRRTDVGSFSKNISVYYGGETIIENTGDSPITIYGAQKYIHYKPVKEKSLSVYNLKPGKSVKVFSTEPNANSTFYLTNIAKVGSFKWTRHREDKTVDTSGSESLGYYINKVYINKKGYTIIENIGNQELEIYGSNKYLNYQSVD